MSTSNIRLMVADVDGTLVTKDKVLTDRAVDAVKRLREAGILFAITSGRPPRGMAMLIDPLDLETPIAAFNGGLLIDRDMVIIEQHVVPDDVVVPMAELMSSFGLDVWIYQGSDWYVPNSNGPHVERETKTVKFAPNIMANIKDHTSGVIKIVGVSDDHAAIAGASMAAQVHFADHVTAVASQPYYLDVTHPQANKGAVVRYLSERYELSSEQIASIGDMPNDILMFAHSGLSIAMGNADPEVQRVARRITSSNDEEGFATAVRDFVLPGKHS